MLALFAGPYGAMIVLAQAVVLGWLFHGLFGALNSGAQDTNTLFRAARARRRPSPAPEAASAFGGSEAPSGGPDPAPEPPRGGAILEVYWDLELRGQTARIVGGRYAGLRLDDLHREECLRLREDCAEEDPVGAIFLDAYIPMRFGEPNSGAEKEKPRFGSGRRDRPPSRGASARARAYAALGLRIGASEKEIVKAHRELIKKVHPDRGGSTARAAAVNEAKDILLEKGR